MVVWSYLYFGYLVIWKAPCAFRFPRIASPLPWRWRQLCLSKHSFPCTKTRNVQKGGNSDMHVFVLKMLWIRIRNMEKISCLNRAPIWPVSIITNSCTHSSIFINPLAPEFFFLILAHSVYKMWITQEPEMVALWNKRHFEEKKTESVQHV